MEDEIEVELTLVVAEDIPSRINFNIIYNKKRVFFIDYFDDIM